MWNHICVWDSVEKAKRRKQNPKKHQDEKKTPGKKSPKNAHAVKQVVLAGAS